MSALIDMLTSKVGRGAAAHQVSLFIEAVSTTIRSCMIQYDITGEKMASFVVVIALLAHARGTSALGVNVSR